MRVTVNVQEAKTRLSELLTRVEAGEEVTIARIGTPVARLEPVDEPRRRMFGVMDMHVPDEVWFDPLPEQELARWEGARGSDPSAGHPCLPVARR